MLNLPSKFVSELPYPEITDACVDPTAVAVIKSLYCSRKSETTAVLQYMYQHFVSGRFADDVAKILSKIGLVEMHHMEMLAEAMTKFGGDPVYFDCNSPLSGRWVNYSKSLFQMLQLDLRDEKDAVQAYKNAAASVCNESLKKLFLRIALDEEMHAAVLEQLIDELEFWGK